MRPRILRDLRNNQHTVTATLGLLAALFGLLWLTLATQPATAWECSLLLDEARKSGEPQAYADAEFRCGPIY